MGQASANRKLTRQLWLFAAGSFAFGFALIPLYDVLCDVTGYGDRSKLLTAAEAADGQADESRTVTLEFVSTAPTVGAWEFTPAATMQVHPGRLYEATFHARNLRAQPIVAVVVPSVAPLQATQYFQKTECFCFTPQPFDAQQQRELKVRFVVDKRLPKNIDRLTLGYAMYDAPDAQQQLSATQAASNKTRS